MANIIDQKSPSHIVGRGGESRLNTPQNESISHHQAARSESLGEKLTLTQTTTHLVKLLNSVSKLPISDTGRIEQIKHAVSSGNYEINSKSTAQKLINMEKNIFLP